MRRYRDFYVSGGDEGRSPEYWDLASLAVDEVMKLIHEGDFANAVDLFEWAQGEVEEFIDCFFETLIFRLGKRSVGAPKTNTEWRKLGIYDFYRLNTNGTQSERIDQLAAEYKVSYSRAHDLLKMGRKLGRNLEAEYLTSLDEVQVILKETPESEPGNWDALVEAVRRSKTSPG